MTYLMESSSACQKVLQHALICVHQNEKISPNRTEWFNAVEWTPVTVIAMANEAAEAFIKGNV
jgi:hypothetical protein